MKFARKIAAAVLGLALTTCGQRHRGAASTIDMSDESSAGQLISGFYGLEGKKWRWTAGQFSVLLQPPPGADEKGGRLQVTFFVPGEQIAKIGSMTLTATVEDQDLEPETVSQGGFLTYSRVVPAAALKSNLIKVDFSFDKSYAPGNGDARTLGVVVSKISVSTL